MVSNNSKSMSDYSTDDEICDMDYQPNKLHQKSKVRKPTRVPKCHSKNALMARENRLKKKMYITSLEEQVAALKSDNKRLSVEVKTQGSAIDDFKKEIKYLKSVIANSEDIGKLMRNINMSTGLSVTSSFNRMRVNSTTEAPNSVVVSASPQQVVPKMEPKNTTPNSAQQPWDPDKHPWEEDVYVNYPTPGSESSTYYSSPEFEVLENEGLLLDMDLSLPMNDEQILEMINTNELEIPADEYNSNTTTPASPQVKEEEDDVGVCLHISKNKVSLEFCQACSDIGKKNWTVT